MHYLTSVVPKLELWWSQAPLRLQQSHYIIILYYSSIFLFITLKTKVCHLRWLGVLPFTGEQPISSTCITHNVQGLMSFLHRTLWRKHLILHITCRQDTLPLQNDNIHIYIYMHIYIESIPKDARQCCSNAEYKIYTHECYFKCSFLENDKWRTHVWKDWGSGNRINNNIRLSQRLQDTFSIRQNNLYNTL